jgi:hypothetical protein
VIAITLLTGVAGAQAATGQIIVTTDPSGRARRPSGRGDPPER